MRIYPLLHQVVTSIALLVAHCTFLNAEMTSTVFLRSYCVDCHDGKTQEADRRFDTLPAEIASLTDLTRYQEIVDQLNLNQMPPKDETQPSHVVRQKMIAQLTQKISTAHAKFKNTGGHSVLRRLNTWEYQQTIGDLLDINVDTWNPAEEFPEEVKVDGFDNNGAGLVTSGMLMDQYLIAAEKAILRATNFGTRPEQKKYVQKSPF